MDPQGRRGQRIGVLTGLLQRGLVGRIGGQVTQHRVGAVEDQAGQWHLLLRQPVDEERRLTQRVGLGS